MVALDIVRGAVDFTGKTVIPVRFSMTRSRRPRGRACLLVRELVAHRMRPATSLLNPGDPSIYATFQRIGARRARPRVRGVRHSGVPELCAVSALERDLTPEMSSPLHIGDDVRRAIGWPGTKVVMKARRSLADTKRILREEGAFDGAELVRIVGFRASACTACSTMCPIGVATLDDGGALDEGFLHSVH